MYFKNSSYFSYFIWPCSELILQFHLIIFYQNCPKKVYFLQLAKTGYLLTLNRFPLGYSVFPVQEVKGNFHNETQIHNKTVLVITFPNGRILITESFLLITAIIEEIIVCCR